MVGDHLEDYTFSTILDDALNRVPSTVDKRQGSIIYDALAPACYRLAEFYNTLRNIYKDTFAQTATDEFLDLRAAEHGVFRYSATYAIKKAYFESNTELPLAVPLGARFSTLSEDTPVTYVVISPYEVLGQLQPGYYNLQCEVEGVIGNEYSGPLTNITHIANLAAATMSDTITPARSKETDEDFRLRYFDTVRQRSFGGNVAQYREELRNISGIGDVQVYPVWDGGGTVKLSIIDAEYNTCSNEFVLQVQDIVDPENGQGTSGLGMGIAPIGHKVTVVTPAEYVANIELNIVLMPSISLGQVTTPIKNAIESYFLTLRKGWGVPDVYNEYTLGIYISRIMAASLDVQGVANVSNVNINGNFSDVQLTQTGALQQLPVVGTVTINE